jgi:hypothetical protein
MIIVNTKRPSAKLVASGPAYIGVRRKDGKQSLAIDYYDSMGVERTINFTVEETEEIRLALNHS